MTADIHFLNAEAEAQMKKAAESNIDPQEVIGWSEVSKLLAAVKVLKTCEAEGLVRHEVVDADGRTMKAEDALDKVRTELAWVKQRVHGERMKIIRGQK